MEDRLKVDLFRSYNNRNNRDDHSILKLRIARMKYIVSYELV